MTSLYDDSGKRKYLTPAERETFLKAADEAEREVRTFCHTLAYTGCRISEALQLTADRVDLKGGVIVFESLKKRKQAKITFTLLSRSLGLVKGAKTKKESSATPVRRDRQHLRVVEQGLSGQAGPFRVPDYSGCPMDW